MSFITWCRKNAATGGIAGLVLATSTVAPLGAARAQAATPKAPVTITYWSQNIPLPKGEIPAFERTHPGIKINEVVVTNYNIKVRTTLKAGGSGAPDALQLQYNEVPSYLISGKLLDLSAYGATSLKDTYVPWVWGQVARGSHVYGIPIDSGPMAMLYRKDIFDKYHLSVPTTWAAYAREAATLHQANPKIYLGNSPVEEGTFEPMLWQAGARPFKVNGSTLSVNWTSPAAEKVANFWNPLIARKVIDTVTAYTPAWYAGLDSGRWATWVAAAWGPLILEPVAKKSVGQWRVAPLPQWTAGAHASANNGGSTAAVTTYSAHPKEAATWVEWLGGSQQSQLINLQSSIFPTLKSVLTSKALTAPEPFFGGQAANAVFAQASNGVDTSWQWSPFDDYVSSQLGTALTAAESGKGTFAQALQKVQGTIVSYAKGQGFTVQ